MARICLWVVCEGINIGWQIYGNIIYWQKENKEVAICKKEKNYAIQLTMFLMIMIGYFYFAFYGMIILMFIVIKARRYRARRSRDQGQQRILRSITRVKFSEELFGAMSADNECIICMTPFGADDIITKLDCPGKHFYHTTCLEHWIRQGSRLCPMCRHEIIVDRPGSPQPNIERAQAYQLDEIDNQA